jgi:hypothetical protein
MGDDGALILIVTTAMLYAWIVWLGAEIVGDAALRFIRPIVEWIARHASKS